MNMAHEEKWMLEGQKKDELSWGILVLKNKQLREIHKVCGDDKWFT
jgi:hypothetical protein